MRQKIKPSQELQDAIKAAQIAGTVLQRAAMMADFNLRLIAIDPLNSSWGTEALQSTLEVKDAVMQLVRALTDVQSNQVSAVKATE